MGAGREPADGRTGRARTTLRGTRKCTMFCKLLQRRNRTFSRSARAPSRFIGCTTVALGSSLSLERPVIGHEAPHAPLSSRIYILPRRSRRAQALDKPLGMARVRGGSGRNPSPLRAAVSICRASRALPGARSRPSPCSSRQLLQLDRAQIEPFRFEPAPIGGSWRWGWCACRLGQNRAAEVRS